MSFPDARRRIVMGAIALSACQPMTRPIETAPTAIRGASVRVLRAGATSPLVGVVEFASADSLVVRTAGRTFTVSARDIDRLQMPETSGERRARALTFSATAGAAAVVLLPWTMSAPGTAGAVVGATFVGPVLAQSLLPTRYRDAVLPSRLLGRDGFLLVPDDGYPEPVGGQRVRLQLGGASGQSVLIGSVAMRGRDSVEVYDPEVGDRIVVARADVLQVSVSRGRRAASPEDATLMAGRAAAVVLGATLLSLMLDGGRDAGRTAVAGALALAAGGVTAWAVMRERWMPATLVAPP